MGLGHSEERCDRIGAEGQAEVIEPESRRGLELAVKISAKLLTQRRRGHSGNQRLALSQGVMAEPLGFENRLAPKETLRISPKARDEIFAGGQLIHTSPQTGEDGTRLGTASGRELEHPIGLGEQAVHIPKAGFGANGRWR
jgi:hypothetical protein